VYNVAVLLYVSVEHNVADDSNVTSSDHLKHHFGADYFAIDAFVRALSVCVLTCVVICNVAVLHLRFIHELFQQQYSPYSFNHG